MAHARHRNIDKRLQEKILQKRSAEKLTETCSCAIGRNTVGNDHEKTCLLYRQRGDDYERLPSLFGRPVYQRYWYMWDGETEKEDR